MAYPEHSVILDQFAEVLRNDVRDALDDNEKYIEAQVGSMSSSLVFLSRHIDAIHDEVNLLNDHLLTALDEVERRLPQSDRGVGSLQQTVEDSRGRLESADGTPREIEGEIIDITNSILNEINSLEDDQLAQRLRSPIYDFLEARVSARLDNLGGQ